MIELMAFCVLIRLRGAIPVIVILPFLLNGLFAERFTSRIRVIICFSETQVWQ